MEGYPGVVVHGPYTMQQLLNFVVDMNPTETLRSFEMKALQPLYVDQPIRLCGKPSEGGKGCEVWSLSKCWVCQTVRHVSRRLWGTRRKQVVEEVEARSGWGRSGVCPPGCTRVIIYSSRRAFSSKLVR